MPNVAEELSRLAALREQGVLSAEEFEAQKARVLSAEQAATPGKPKRSIAKIGLGCGGLIVVLLIFAAIVGGGGNGDVVPPGQTAGASAASAGPSLTMDGYNRISTGMTYEQVVAIVGEPSQEVSRNEIAGLETVMYMWQGSLGANMNAMFQDGKLVQKAQFGLR